MMRMIKYLINHFLSFITLHMQDWRVKMGQRVITKRKNTGVMIELKPTISHTHGQLTKQTEFTQLLHAK